MPYADNTFYRDTYAGAAVSDDTELTRLLTKASNDIDLICNYNFTFSELDATDQKFVKMATCAQAESYAVHGEDDQDFQNISLGAFSISGGGKKNQNSYVCDNALKYLYMTSFYQGAIIVCGKSRR